MGLWNQIKSALKPSRATRLERKPQAKSSLEGEKMVIPVKRSEPPPRPPRKTVRKSMVISRKRAKQQTKREKHRGQFARVLKRIQGERKGGYIPEKFALDNLTDIEMGKETSRIGYAINQVARNRRKREIQKESRRRNRSK